MTESTGENCETEQRAMQLLKAFNRAYNPNDLLGVYDPLLGVVGPSAGHRRVHGGYKIWPVGGEDPKDMLRIMTIGNSTSLWPSANWSEQMAEMLSEDGEKLTLFHGAGKGSTSTQDVLRVLRDAPGIEPHLIVSLSGITDIGYLLLAADNPYSHKYVRRVMQFVGETDMVSNVIYGYPNRKSPAQNWCHNQRMMNVIARGLGIPLLTFLQPVQGYGAYPLNDEERSVLEQKSKVKLLSIDKPYGVCVTEFYTEAFEIMAASPDDFRHVVDFTDVFHDCPGAYRDHRHQNEIGVAHLAKRIYPVVKDRLASIKADKPTLSK